MTHTTKPAANPIQLPVITEPPIVSFSQLKEFHFISDKTAFFYTYHYDGREYVNIMFAEDFDDAEKRLARIKMGAHLGGLILCMAPPTAIGRLQRRPCDLCETIRATFMRMIGR